MLVNRLRFIAPIVSVLSRIWDDDTSIRAEARARLRELLIHRESNLQEFINFVDLNYVLLTTDNKPLVSTLSDINYVSNGMAEVDAYQRRKARFIQNCVRVWKRTDFGI